MRKKLYESTYKKEGFENTLDNYGITNIDLIRTMVDAKYSNIDKVCASLNISKLDTNIVFMLLARDCYINSLYYMGDKLLQTVFPRVENHKQQKEIWAFIKKNRDLYAIKYALEKKPLVME